MLRQVLLVPSVGGFESSGLGFRVWGSGFRVPLGGGVECRIQEPQPLHFEARQNLQPYHKPDHPIPPPPLVVFGASGLGF